MNLSDYIKQVGEHHAAKLFGVSVYAIKSWRYGQRAPRPDKANEIVAATGGAVTLSGIYNKQSH